MERVELDTSINEGAEIPPTNEGEPNTDESRPDWLPKKFKSPEDMAKSYSELEKKLGQGSPSEEEEEGEGEEGETEESKQTEAPPGISEEKLAEFGQAWADQGGEFTEEQYAELAKMGLNKAYVDAYAQGQLAIMERQVQEVFSIVGGEENYRAMQEWANDKLDETEQAAFDKMISSDDQDVVRLAVQDLSEKWQLATGQGGGKLLKGKPSAPSKGDVFESTAEMLEAMRLKDSQGKVKYKTDPSYRSKVQQKIARSNL